MLRFNLYIHSVKERLKGHYGNMIECYESDNNADQLVMRIHLKVAGNGGQESSDLLTDLKALEHTILEKLIIKGVEGIEQVSISQSEKNVHDPVTNTYTKREESVVYTEGTNFRKILANDKVDAERIYTNNVIEVYEVLGIEAARQAMFNEIMIVLEAVTVNYRHVALLVDYQTNKGALMSIDRHGINRGDIGPLAKCSFEESTDKLIKAGIFAEYDRINGVSANIMLGQITPAGTGDVTLIMDEDKLPLHPSSDETRKDKVGEKEKETANQCAFEFDFVVPRAADL
jgi:DNA-directed RNA polymerase II subunit RPB1